MTTPSALQALRVPGQLAVGPFSDLTAAWPHGGTGLGLTGPARFRRARTRRPIRAEEYGGAPVDVVEGAIVWSVAFPMRGWDPDGVQKLFPGYFTGSSGGLVGLREKPNTTRAGVLGSARAVQLLFTPLDADRHRGVFLYRAIPWEAQELDIDFGHDPEQVLLAGFLAVPDASDRLIEVQLLEDMTTP